MKEICCVSSKWRRWANDTFKNQGVVSPGSPRVKMLRYQINERVCDSYAVGNSQVLQKDFLTL
eukprot:1901193-Prymnesium_polylepis.1